MKRFWTNCWHSQINEQRNVSLMFGWFTVLALVFGDTDHYGIVILNRFWGWTLWTEIEWLEFLRDDGQISYEEFKYRKNSL